MWWSSARVSTRIRNPSEMLSDPSSIVAMPDDIMKAFMMGPVKFIEKCEMIFAVLAGQNGSQMDKHLVSHSRDDLRCVGAKMNVMFG